MTPPRRCAEERGQITAMLVIFAICLMLAISAVINIAASYPSPSGGHLAC